MCGFYPFDDAKYPVMFANIKKGRFSFPSPFWDNVSAGAKDLITVRIQCWLSSLHQVRRTVHVLL